MILKEGKSQTSLEAESLIMDFNLAQLYNNLQLIFVQEISMAFRTVESL